MILKFILKIGFSLLKMVLRIVFGGASVIPLIPQSFITNFLDRFSFVIEKASVLFFLFVRPSTFSFVIDVLFWLHAFVPIYALLMFVLRKIPFFNIK